MEAKPVKSSSSTKKSTGSDSKGSSSSSKSKETAKTTSTGLTDKEAQENIKQAKTLCAAIVKSYTPKNHRKNEELQTNLVKLRKLYSVFKPLSPEKCAKARREVGDIFVASGCVPITCEIVMDYLTNGCLDSKGRFRFHLAEKCEPSHAKELVNKADMAEVEALNTAMSILFNFSDTCSAIPKAAASVSGFYECIAGQLKIFYAKLMAEKNMSPNDRNIMDSLLGITNNSSGVRSARRRLRALGYTTIVMPYLNAKDDEVKLVAIVCLANLVDEKESALLNASKGAVKFLLHTMGKALKAPTRRSTGWSARELAHGVAKLAANDSNKKMLVSEGALPLLLQLSFVDNEEEQKEAVGAIWALSFDDQNKDLIIKEPGLIKRLVELEKSPYAEVKKAAQGIQWTLRYKLKESSEFKKLGEKLIGSKPDKSSGKSSSGTENATGPHVMISYQWDNQDTLIKVRDALKSHGYKTWMDVDYMGGSTLQAMGEAVENSAAVLICISQQYKDSPNCRAEAEYAFQRRVPIIPLMMEGDYRPDGWLGIILGSKLYFDFSGKFSFTEKFEGLMKELGGKGQAKDVTDNGKSAGSDKGETSQVMNWGKKEITAWLKKIKLDKPSLRELTGKKLLFLKNVKSESPEMFYNLMQKDFDLTSTEDLMTFVQALMDLN